MPVETAAPLNRGMTVTRSYYRRGSDCTSEPCPSLQSAGVNQQVLVRVTLAVPQDAYYVLLEDYIPAGSEILDTSLKTSQLGSPDRVEGETPEQSLQPEAAFDAQDPISAGWGRWAFHSPLVYDDHIAWSADYLEAGTYVMEYIFTPLQPGEYRVLPARARQMYFPDVQGSSGGMIFTINAAIAP